MKKILTFALTGAILLTGCSSSTPEVSTSESNIKNEENNSSGVYVEIYSQSLGEHYADPQLSVIFNKETGCVSEYIEFQGNRTGGAGYKDMLGNDKEPICDISEKEARDMFRP